MNDYMDFKTFLATYVNTNISPGSVDYDAEFLLGDLLEQLLKSDSNSFANVGLQILIAMCCAMKRGDFVPAIFETVLERRQASQTATLELFYRTRETLNIIWPFVGVPQIIPAALGLAGYLRFKNIEIKDNRRRPNLGPEDVDLGTETRKKIYKASSNSEVFEMLADFHGDFAYVLNAIGFGYNIGRVSSLNVPLPEAELILTSALIALNATRQAGSHVKACIGFGYTEVSLQAVAEMAERLAEWQGSTVSRIDISNLARQARDNLKGVK